MKQHIHKQLVIDFYKKVIGEQDLNYARKSVTDDYIQHNPQVKTGKSGFLEAITFLKQLPKPNNPPTPFMRILVDNEYVVVHWNVAFGGQKKIVLDLFRLENGLIAEHWDAIQNTSETTLNGNSEIEGPIMIENEDATLLHKKIVKRFTKNVLIDRNMDLIENYVAHNVIQHNPKMNNGLDGFMEYYQEHNVQKVYKIIGQGNFVVTQSKGIMEGQECVYYNIYRLQNGLIVEHWSVSQMIPEVMVHNNGMI